MTIKIKDIARVCHESNRGYCLCMGDKSQVPWEEAPEWQRQSSIRGVKALIATPDLDPRGQHEAWMKDKLAEGWQYGQEKDPANKRHPLLVPYEELPAAQQAKDYIFQAIVRTMLAIHDEESEYAIS